MKMFAMLCAAALSVAGFAGAQSMPDTVLVHFDVPVMVGQTVFPAGDATIQFLRGTDGVMLKFLSTSTSAGAALVQVNRTFDAALPVAGQVSVTLTRHDNSYQLDKVLFPEHLAYQVVN